MTPITMNELSHRDQSHLSRCIDNPKISGKSDISCPGFDDLAPRDHPAWYPEPRGVGRSGGGPHTMEEAIADLEGIRKAVGVGNWIVVGHPRGCDLGVRYAVEHPEAVAAVVGIAGRGPQRDRTWSEAYESGKIAEPIVEIDWVPDVHAALSASFTDATGPAPHPARRAEARPSSASTACRRSAQ